MHPRRVIAAFAVLGLVAFAAASFSVSGALGCQDKEHASMTGGACCSGHATMTQVSAGVCPYMAKGTGGGCCTQGATATAQCNMPAAQCEKMMRTYYKTHGWLGAEMACAGENAQPTITKVMPGSPAATAGFQVGDVLTSIEGVSFDPQNQEKIQALMMNGYKVGQVVHYTAKRQDQAVNLEAKLVKIPKASLNVLVADHLATAHKGQMKQDKTMEKSS